VNLSGVARDRGKNRRIEEGAEERKAEPPTIVFGGGHVRHHKLRADRGEFRGRLSASSMHASLALGRWLAGRDGGGLEDAVEAQHVP
jgi:hypothetical protein